MNTNRIVKSYWSYEEARKEKERLLLYFFHNDLVGKRKVKIKVRNSGMYDVISYDINSVEEEST